MSTHVEVPRRRRRLRAVVTALAVMVAASACTSSSRLQRTSSAPALSSGTGPVGSIAPGGGGSSQPGGGGSPLPGGGEVGGGGGGGGGGGPVATFPSGSNLVTLDGNARSVETTSAVGGLSSVHLAGSSVLTGSGDVIDHSGRHLGTGTLRTAGSDLVVAGPGIQLSARLRVQPGQVTITGGSATLTLAAPSTVTASSLTFQPPAPPASSTTNPPVATTVPPPFSVAGPVTIAAGSVSVAGTSLRYVDAPIDIKLTPSEADLSWAGTGSISTASGRIEAPYLGVRAQQLDVSLHRGSGSVAVRGTGLALQAFANGVPQLRTPASVEILSTHATTGFLGHRPAFAWTPRNLGSTYDMAILRIRPGNSAAGGVHIGLRPMPPMFGGEPHALVGGDTSGLKGGDAIDSLIARHGDDKRSVGYDAAAGVQLVLIVEGNFDPITVTITTY